MPVTMPPTQSMTGMIWCMVGGLGWVANADVADADQLLACVARFKPSAC